MEQIKDALTCLALFGFFCLEGYTAYRVWRLGKRLDKIIDEIEGDLRDGG